MTYACALRRRGHDVVVAAGGGPLAAEVEQCGVSRLDARAHIRRPWSIIRAAAALRRLHKTSPFDVVHSFMASTSVVAAIARFGLTKPYALVSAPPGLVQDVDESRWLTRSRTWLLAAGSDLILVPSGELRAQLRAALGQRARMLDLNFNGVDLARFDVPPVSRASLGIREGEGVICSVARLHPVKGQDFLIRAMLLVRKRRSDVRLILVGEGPARADLEDLVARLGVSDIVTFLGARTDVPGILRAVDVVVQTTHGAGGPGLVVLEAFAAAKPVVAFAFEDLREAVAGADAAVLVRRGDVEGLAEAIAALLSDRERARSMGASGRALVEANYSTERIADRLTDVYSELVSARS